MERFKFTAVPSNQKQNRQYLKSLSTKSLELILSSKMEKIEELYNELSTKIQNRQISIGDIAKKISLGKSIKDYLETSSKKLPHFEVWIAAGELDKKKGTPTEHYRCEGDEKYKLSRDYNNDYDIKYYLKSLDSVKLLLKKVILHPFSRRCVVVFSPQTKKPT